MMDLLIYTTPTAIDSAVLSGNDGLDCSFILHITCVIWKLRKNYDDLEKER
jgi:hypothetical protein